MIRFHDTIVFLRGAIKGGQQTTLPWIAIEIGTQKVRDEDETIQKRCTGKVANKRPIYNACEGISQEKRNVNACIISIASD